MFQDKFRRGELDPKRMGEFIRWGLPRSGDWYPDPDRFATYKREKLSRDSSQRYVSFCSAGLPDPYPEVRLAAQELLQQEENGNFFRCSWEHVRPILIQARCNAAKLMGLKDERGVVLCRNTTEAISFFKGAAHFYCHERDLSIHSSLRIDSQGAPSYIESSPFEGVCIHSDVETLSVRQILVNDFPIDNKDHINGLTTYSDNAPSSGQSTVDRIVRERLLANKIEPYLFPCRGLNLSQRLEKLDQVVREVTKNTPENLLSYSSFIVSHVDRATGEVLPVKELIRKLKECWDQHACGHQYPVILVDGAQAFFNLNQIDLGDIGCDLYAASPHKTMGSEVLGLLFFDTNNPRLYNFTGDLNKITCNQLPICEGMFHSSHGLYPNTSEKLCYADLVGFNRACEVNRDKFNVFGNDLSRVETQRKNLQKECLEKLTGLTKKLGIKLILPEIETPSSFITSFNFTNVKALERFLDDEKPIKLVSHQIAISLQNLGVFLTYIEDVDLFRLAFRPDHTSGDIDLLIDSLAKVLPSFVEQR